MRPYVIEAVMIFAAGMCVGAFLAEHARTVTEEDPVLQKEEAKRGVLVTMEDGKIVIDPTKRRRWFGGKRK